MALIETRFRSEILDQSLGMNIILPEHPEAWKEPPAVLYLLHGLSDDHTVWSRRTSIERYAHDYNLVVVMPDAHKSFYCNMAHGSDYLTFIAEELPERIRQWFNAAKTPQKTFIAGLSMGGYGAFRIALENPDQYAAAASLSGALDLASHIHETWPENHVRAFDAAFGNLENLPGSPNDLIARLKNLATPPATAFYVGVGADDYLYNDSVSFKEAAGKAGLNLTYEESEGGHQWTFWDREIKRVLQWLPIEKLPDVN